MNLSMFKSVHWMIGIFAVLALAGVVAGSMLLTSSPSSAPGIVNQIDSPHLIPDTDEPPATASVATYTRFPQLRLEQDTRADLVENQSPAAIEKTSVPQAEGPAPTSVSISPVEDWNSIFDQHTFTVTVNGADGAPATGVEVEVFLNRFDEAVGDIVSLGGENPRKVDNYFGRVMTDDSGQATLTITATRPGDTDVTAFVPQIVDNDTHKVFAVKHWVDMSVEFPSDAVNLVGTDHPMLVRVSKVTDGSPIADVNVAWSVVDADPAATLDGVGQAAATTTNANGETVVTLQQVEPAIGDNQVYIQVLEAGTNKTMFSHTHTKQWQSPTLEVNKEGPPSLGLRKTAEYSVSVTNSGDSTATNVTLTDELPQGLTFVSSTPEAASAAGSTITWSLGDIAPGASVEVTMVLSANNVGEQINTATAVSVEGITGQDTSLTSVIPGSLQLAKSGPTETVSGDDVTYEITVTNDGAGALTNIVLTDTLPLGLTYVSSSPEAAVGADGRVSWLIESLDSEATATVTLVATTGDPGEVVNTANVLSDEGATASAQATTLVTRSDLSITKTADNAAPILGQPTVYTIAVTNNGDATATNVAVVDALPLEFQNVTAEPEASVGADGSLQWTIAAIEPGGTANITINATSTVGGTLTNTVSATERGVTVTADATIGVLVPAVSLAKSGGSALYVDGERTYTISATNTGTANLTDVTITDNIPAEMSYVSSDNGGQEADGVVTWSIGDLAVGATVDVNVTLRGESVGAVINTANVTSAEGASADAVLNIQILAAAAAHLSIIDGVDPMGVGEEGSYTVVITNQSDDSPMTDVRLTVTVPAQFAIITAAGGTISGGTVTYTAVPSLEAGGELEYTVTVEAVSAGDVVASATLRYAEFGQPITAQEGTTIVQR
ncbi:MAG: hypothetical protein OXI91_08950 [Chloroflexota bacterium]|nr:hypothetical protein [Chloroflexota bacterium]